MLTSHLSASTISTPLAAPFQTRFRSAADRLHPRQDTNPSTASRTTDPNGEMSTVIGYWFQTAHEPVLRLLIVVTVGLYVAMARDIAAEVRG